MWLERKNKRARMKSKKKSKRRNNKKKSKRRKTKKAPKLRIEIVQIWHRAVKKKIIEQ